MSKGPARRIRLRAVVAYPAVSLAMMAAIALVLTPFGSAQSMALDAAPTATETSAPTATATTDPTAPTTTEPTTAAPTTTTTTAAPGPVPSPTPGPLLTLTSAGGAVQVDHLVLGRIDGPGLAATYLPVGAPAQDALRHQRFRVRFQVRNTGAAPVTATPRLEYRAAEAAGFAVVPEGVQPGSALHVAREWIPSPEPDGGTMQGPLGEDIAAGHLRIPSAVGVPAAGHHSMGVNPDAPITLPADSYTEQEFTVLLTAYAQYLTAYELRITDAGAALTGTQVATIRLGEPPAFQPSTQQGIAVAAPEPAGAVESIPQPVPPIAANTAPAPALSSARSAFPAALAAPAVSDQPRYALVPVTIAPSAAVPKALAAAIGPTPHGPYGLVDGQCAACHRTHTAKDRSLHRSPSPQSTWCFTCHDGTGAVTNVKATYTDPAVPQNVVSDRRIFRHDTLVATSHKSVTVNEFGGKSDRHSECSDCHDSHRASGADSVATSTGFTNSGRLMGSSGVSVVNGAAGTAPTYTYLPGGTNPITREYQLCFKCHSGFTTLDSNVGFTPSRFRLDKGIEFNPANPSYHPVEAAGKNTSPKMTASLAGSSPYKQWNLTNTSTISCANCHSNYLRYNLVTKPALTASAPLHASNTAGILRQPYRNRLLKPQNEVYKDSDFALCYMCHSNTPFATDGGGTDRTNFFLHGYHTAALAGQGLIGQLIDEPRAGGGNAICAECHFRQHSTTFKDTTVPQEINGTRLVSFSPNVEAVNGVRKWTSTGVGQGSCTLRCHGKTHAGTIESYP